MLKNPTHLERIPYLLKAYPDAKFFFTHRDPVTSNDSVITVQANVANGFQVAAVQAEVTQAVSGMELGTTRWKLGGSDL